MPKFKTVPVDFLDKPRTASFGMPELREISSIVKADILRGESWAKKVYEHEDGVEVAAKVLHVLLKRDDPAVTIEDCEFVPDIKTLTQVLDVFFRLELDKSFDDLVKEGKEGAEKASSPLSQTPSSGHTAN